MQLAPQLADLAGVVGHRLLAPPVGDGLQEPDERGGPGQQHPLLGGVLEQVGVRLGRAGQDGVAGHEEHDEVGGGVEGLLVPLGGQGVDVVAHLPGVVDEAALAGGLVRRLARLEEALQRHLGVDDHGLAAGQADDQVGADPGPVRSDGPHLLLEVAVADHAGDLDDPAELQLAPAAPHGRRPQGGDEVGRLRAQVALGQRERLDLGQHGGVGLGPGHLEALHPVLDLLQNLGHRADEAGDHGGSGVELGCTLGPLP